MLNHGYLEIMSCPSVMDALVATPGYIKLFFLKKLAHLLYFIYLSRQVGFVKHEQLLDLELNLSVE
jgi:hypothetical protein